MKTCWELVKPSWRLVAGRGKSSLLGLAFQTLHRLAGPSTGPPAHSPPPLWQSVSLFLNSNCHAFDGAMPSAGDAFPSAFRQGCQFYSLQDPAAASPLRRGFDTRAPAQGVPAAVRRTFHFIQLGAQSADPDAHPWPHEFLRFHQFFF